MAASMAGRREHDTPNRARLYDIYTDCLVDLHLTGCIGQRKGKSAAKGFPTGGKGRKGKGRRHQTAAKGVVQRFLRPRAGQPFWGHSLIQLGDIVSDENGMRFEGVEIVPRKRVCPEYGVYVPPEPAADWRTGIPYRDGDLSLWCVEVGKPKDLGLLLKCAPSCISKKNMLAFWDMFGEIFGTPMRVARTNTTDEAERRRIEGSLDKMGAAFWALFPEGTDIEILGKQPRDAYNVYDKRVDRCNSELSKGTLMQTMTIDSGSSLSQSETHLEIFEDVVKADAKMVANVVNDKLLPLMARHGFPVQGLTFQWDDAASFSPAERREEERLLLEYYEIDPQYFVDNYNIPITGVRQAKTQPDAFFG